MAVTIVLATHNAGKLVEMRRILDVRRLASITLLSAAEAGLDEPDETGETFADNALLKARAGAVTSGLACLADDSGLEVDALGGDPGVLSARYAGTHGDDVANLELVLKRMDGVRDRRARFVCVAALVTPAGEEYTARGTLEGTLTDQPRGSNGFGYDPIFKPLGATVTTAELTTAQKDAISHRGAAFRGIAGCVATYLDSVG